MYWTKTILAALTLLTATDPVVLPSAAAPGLDPDPRDLAAAAKVDFGQALRTAVGERAGRVAEVELEAGEDADAPRLVWEIDVVTADGLVEVTVDAIAGGVVGVETEDEEEEFELYRRVLRHAEKSIDELAVAAGEVVRGKVVAAEFATRDGQPVAEFLIANGRYLLAVAVEARAGHLVAVEMVDELGEPDEEDEEQDGAEETEEDGQGSR